MIFKVANIYAEDEGLPNDILQEFVKLHTSTYDNTDSGNFSVETILELHRIVLETECQLAGLSKEVFNELYAFFINTYETATVKELHIDFDSYMRQEDDLEIDDFRLLEVDRLLLLPVGVQIRLNFTGADVIHS